MNQIKKENLINLFIVHSSICALLVESIILEKSLESNQKNIFLIRRSAPRPRSEGDVIDLDLILGHQGSDENSYCKIRKKINHLIKDLIASKYRLYTPGDHDPVYSSFSMNKLCIEKCYIEEGFLSYSYRPIDYKQRLTKRIYIEVKKMIGIPNTSDPYLDKNARCYCFSNLAFQFSRNKNVLDFNVFDKKMNGYKAYENSILFINQTYRWSSVNSLIVDMNCVKIWLDSNSDKKIYWLPHPSCDEKELSFNRRLLFSRIEEIPRGFHFTEELIASFSGVAALNSSVLIYAALLGMKSKSLWTKDKYIERYGIYSYETLHRIGVEFSVN